MEAEGPGAGENTGKIFKNTWSYCEMNNYLVVPQRESFEIWKKDGIVMENESTSGEN